MRAARLAPGQLGDVRVLFCGMESTSPVAYASSISTPAELPGEGPEHDLLAEAWDRWHAGQPRPPKQKLGGRKSPVRRTAVHRVSARGRGEAELGGELPRVDGQRGRPAGAPPGAERA